MNSTYSISSNLCHTHPSGEKHREITIITNRLIRKKSDEAPRLSDWKIIEMSAPQFIGDPTHTEGDFIFYSSIQLSNGEVRTELALSFAESHTEARIDLLFFSSFSLYLTRATNL